MMQAVSAARRALVLDQPFFGVLSLKLELVEDKSNTKTLKTDGKRLWFNPEYVATLSKHELKGVIAHEVLHCGNGHTWRREHRDPKGWNEAADLAINPIVLDAGMVLPKGALDGTPYKGKSPEEIYAIRQKERQSQPQEQQQNSNSQGNGQGNPGSNSSGGQDDAQDNGCGEVVDSDESDTHELKADWSASVLQAAKQAQAMGNLPAGMARLLNEIKNPPQDWRAILRRFIQENATDDYSWKTPNARYLSLGLYMPSLRSESMPPMVVAVDTSGSVSDLMVSQFTNEINAIVDEVQPQAVHVIYCDAKIQGVDVFEKGEPITIVPKGFGGTDFRPVFKWIEEQDLTPSCLVYLTDMAGRFPAVEPDYPVLWGDTNGDYPAPWGETVRVRCQ
ncbi:DUF2201 family putative metallopeptidase [Simplicispira suum]|uniref:Metallopeptidase domain-containing protein n=1 Tax=Simplicispira suum TaxID=2109915 RepID=A0A2S0N694_9BURK|nr:VWA-like domain-containing protein [Simplicispira suum]AVO43483.1 hypothetical protein C6571_18845 [Simplicispira suum]